MFAYLLFFTRRLLCILTRIHVHCMQVVPFSAGEALAKEFAIPFMETSAVQSINVDEAFERLILDVYKRLEDQGIIPPRLSSCTSNVSNSNGSSPTGPAKSTSLSARSSGKSTGFDKSGSQDGIRLQNGQVAATGNNNCC